MPPYCSPATCLPVPSGGQAPAWRGSPGKRMSKWERDYSGIITGWSHDRARAHGAVPHPAAARPLGECFCFTRPLRVIRPLLRTTGRRKVSFASVPRSVDMPPTGSDLPGLRRCLEVALNRLPAGIPGSGATPGMRGEGVQARSPLCRTEPSARGVAPATARAARPATGGRAARPQDATAQADGRKVRCESPRGRIVNRPPSSFSRSRTATSGSARASAGSRQPSHRRSGQWSAFQPRPLR